ncbi:hypothetical protein L2725_14075 [Shewanella corallii]|uniref:Uncharacterized protein n=1 Tax=Shewanella corallii TaxID=560080 RepID=A0ABT0N8W1_9GAMM|nr:hypothetical protein [Shewanella corallii]MCL2914891.1 hypothetical protein [Shewanella corallii]
MKADDFTAINWLAGANHIDVVLRSEYAWRWLPSSRDEEDPLGGGNGRVQLTLSQSEWVRQRYKGLLVSLRQIDHSHPKLQSGPHNYVEAFKGAALYAGRKSAIETVLNTEGSWREIFSHYLQGRWPCGIKDDGIWVVL